MLQSILSIFCQWFKQLSAGVVNKYLVVSYPWSFLLKKICSVSGGNILCVCLMTPRPHIFGTGSKIYQLCIKNGGNINQT